MTSKTQTIAPQKRPTAAIIFGVILLSAAYGLLGLTQFQHPNMASLHAHCVLMNPRLSRIWSVANVEVGLAYFGVFGAMSYYILVTKDARDRHLTDLVLACIYLACSFCLDFLCVRYLSPFPALLVGDAIVMTFTLLVSRQLWFQRLLGVFVPMVFLTCGLGHFLEGLSYWQLTYPLNVPWSMVTADIGFAVLVNAARYPAFIRGTDVVEEMAGVRAAASHQAQFFHNVLYAVTDGRFRFHVDGGALPRPLEEVVPVTPITRETLSAARHLIANACADKGFRSDRTDVLITAAGEAMMNSVVHGADATLRVCADRDSVQVWVSDRGHGISLDDLPRATLRHGWSSRGTLGMGFSMILSLADGVDLLTGNAGTTIVITVVNEPEKCDASTLFGIRSLGPDSALSFGV